MLIKNKSRSGFTLLELMVALAIIAVLAAVAMPLIKDYKWRAHRIEARNALQALSQRLNTAYQVNKKFVGSDGTTLTLDSPEITSVVDKDKIPRGCTNNCYYKFDEATVINDTDYTLVVVPTDTQARKDKKCTKFSLTNTGSKGANGGTNAADVKECWSR
ncbi:MAG: prepilin-type N-terminal cleavage/methylation domain-containing protein [Cardiobacteriaceae bacterium]|nr:prepilin-type N-terminal cleavage/methylation domain-containing protein [Cardiobacteriaceae bacterium]